MSLVDDVLGEGARLLAEVQPLATTSIYAKADLYDWLEAYAEALLRVARAAMNYAALTDPASQTCEYLDLREALDDLGGPP